MNNVESQAWWPFAERYIENELRKAKNFQDAKRVMDMEGHLKAVAPFIEELLKLRTPEDESGISADTESEFYKQWYKPSKMSVKTTGDHPEKFNHGDFYL